jgi:cobalt-zinc-cadmium efflux system outer membrane protein
MFSGCASVDVHEEWSQFKKTSMDRIGVEPLWEQSEDDELRIQQMVNSLLADGLTREEAVQIALINNRHLQSTFEEIGISKSELVQAGLFRNPTLGAIFRFPFGGGSTNIDADGFFAISDLWQMPFRKKVASAQLEITMLRVGEELLDTAAEAKRSFENVYYTELARDEAKGILQKFREISQRIKVRKDFGFTSDMDVYLSQAMIADAEIQLHRLERELVMARAHLDNVLGLNRQVHEYQIEAHEKYHQLETLDVRALINFAMDSRLDIQVARFKIKEAERRLDLEKMRVFREVNLGVSYERDTDGDEVFGPGVDIQLPIFDQNQAQIARAGYLVRRARKRHEDLERHIIEEVTGDLEKINLFRENSRLLSAQVIPLRKKALDYAMKWVQAMQLSRLHMLEAQRGLMESQLAFIEARMALANAFLTLERHLGGDLP